MKIAIIDYGAGNTRSVQFAFDRLGISTVVTADPDELKSAEGVVFPGVGHAASALESLKKSGLDKLIPTLKQPVLGICLGMQLMCESSEEGNSLGLGIFKEKVKRFSDQVKVPQIGWNQVEVFDNPLFEGVESGSFLYFVHSYYVPKMEFTKASTNYDVVFSAAIQKDNFYACQFHPEKSGANGERILKNFIALCE